MDDRRVKELICAYAGDISLPETRYQTFDAYFSFALTAKNAIPRQFLSGQKRPGSILRLFDEVIS